MRPGRHARADTLLPSRPGPAAGQQRPTRRRGAAESHQRRPDPAGTAAPPRARGFPQAESRARTTLNDLTQRAGDGPAAFTRAGDPPTTDLQTLTREKWMSLGLVAP